MSIDVTYFFDFFVPGVLFTLIWFQAFQDKLTYFSRLSPTTQILLCAVIGFVLGFLIQALWTLVKIVFNKIIIEPWTGISGNEFNTYNRYVWIHNIKDLPEYFAKRAAFSGSLIMGSFISIFIVFQINYYWSIVSFGGFVIFVIIYCNLKIKEYRTAKGIVKEHKK